jgi:hypothetical protein
MGSGTEISVAAWWLFMVISCGLIPISTLHVSVSSLPLPDQQIDIRTQKKMSSSIEDQPSALNSHTPLLAFMKLEVLAAHAFFFLGLLSPTEAPCRSWKKIEFY